MFREIHIRHQSSILKYFLPVIPHYMTIFLNSQIANYKMPYKISHHPVCTYGRYRRRTVQLTHCDPRHPDRSYTVIDAVSCNCKLCNPHNTSCESLSG